MKNKILTLTLALGLIVGTFGGVASASTDLVGIEGCYGYYADGNGDVVACQ